MSDVGGREVACEIVQLYLELLPERQQAVAEAARTDDLVRLRRETHTLASASAVVGAAELRALCQQLESAYLAGEVLTLRALLDAWSSSGTATKDALTAWCAES